MAIEGGCSGSVEITQNFPVNIRDFARRKESVAK
jgi:hypothetical protein